MGRVLMSPLNWGLGHATRDIPIIREILNRGHDVDIASSGNALDLLKKEFPECNFILYKDYPAPYSGTRFFLPKFSAYIPLMIKAMIDEHRNLDKMVSRSKYDLIISDNRLGVFSKKIPSYFITHQLRFSTPDWMKPVEIGTLYVNGYFHTMFTGVIVPDISPHGANVANGINGTNGAVTNLSGKLAISHLKRTNDRAYYAGILTSTRMMDVEEDLDYLFIISGPEPQRTKLEEIVLKQVRKLPGEKVVLLGSPRRDVHERLDESTWVHSFVPTDEKISLMNRARFIISRSGYTTMMEMAELSKKRGLFTPTPGQTEQEYLSRYYVEKGWFLSKSQYKIDLVRDCEEAEGYKGFPDVPGTGENVRRLYDDLFARHLE